MSPAATETPDAEQRVLVAEAQAGDERAFRRLTEPYRQALEVHCYRMLGSVHDAEDVVQEVMLRGWRALDGFERRASVTTWLYRIATNACLDELERRPRVPQPVQPYPDERLEQAASPAYDPAARYALREGMELALLTAIQLLPGRQRAVLILRDVLGWSAQEVADLLDTTVAAVTSALQRARGTVDGALPATRLAAGPNDRALLARYVEAWERDDVDALVALLRTDAELRMPPQASVRGDEAIVAFLRERGCEGQGLRNIRVRPSSANGRPAIVMHLRRGTEHVPHGLLLLETSEDEIVGLDAFIDEALPRLFD